MSNPPSIETLPDGTRYAVVHNWHSRGYACPVHLPADVVAIDAETWGAAYGDPVRAVSYVRLIKQISRSHRRISIPRQRDEREREADYQSRRGRFR